MFFFGFQVSDSDQRGAFFCSRTNAFLLDKAETTVKSRQLF
jgi:hypothetical protein